MLFFFRMYEMGNVKFELTSHCDGIKLKSILENFKKLEQNITVKRNGSSFAIFVCKQYGQNQKEQYPEDGGGIDYRQCTELYRKIVKQVYLQVGLEVNEL